MTRIYSDCDACGIAFSQEGQYCPRCHPREFKELTCDVCGEDTDFLHVEDGIEMCTSCWLGGD